MRNKLSRNRIIAGALVVILPIFFAAFSSQIAGILLGLNFPGGQKLSAPVEKGSLLGELPFKNVQADTRLKDSFPYSELGHSGVINQQAELLSLSIFVFTYDAEYKIIQNPTLFDPTATLIWYADKGVNASFSSMTKVLEYENLIEVYITSFHSDFGSNAINFWQIPKTDKPARFVEDSYFEERSGSRQSHETISHE